MTFSIKEPDLLVEKMRQFSVLYANRSAVKIIAGEAWLEKSNKSEMYPC